MNAKAKCLGKYKPPVIIIIMSLWQESRKVKKKEKRNVEFPTNCTSVKTSQDKRENGGEKSILAVSEL